MSLRARLREVYVFLRFSWQLGIVSSTRRQYWRQLLGMIRKNPSRLMGYLVSCARGEGMFDLRDLLRQRRLQVQRQVKT